MRPASQQVCWAAVHHYVAERLDCVQSWPAAGTPDWCELDDRDPAKLAAVLDAGQHWALRIELNQEARRDASHAIADAYDWAAISREISRRRSFYAERPWMNRRAAS